MATTVISLNSVASFGNPLWRTGATNPLANSAIPASLASATVNYKVSTTQSAEILLPLQALVLTAYITSLQVTITAAVQTTPPNLPTLVSLGILVNGSYQFTQSQPLVMSTVNVLSFPTKPDGTAWLNTDVINTVIKIIDQSTSGLGNLASLSINAISTSIPTGVITPQTTIASSTPQVTWVYADADLALQSGYQVQVLDTQAGTIIADSGFIIGLDTSYQVPANVTVDNHLSSSIGAFGSLTGSPTSDWISLCSSTDGTIVYAGVNNGSVYKSIDSGVTWTAVSGTSGLIWTSLACSSNGLLVYGVVASGAGQGIYVPVVYLDGGNSTTASAVVYDGGSASTVSWTVTIDSGTSAILTNDLTLVSGTSGVTYTAIACSADGSKVFASSNAGGIFVSIDGGTTFALTAGTTALNFRSIACSDSGIIVYSAVTAGSIYRSIDTGASFASVAGTTPFAWTGIACSSDGLYVYACINGGKIYASVNSGVTFAVLAASSTLAWTAVDCSPNGAQIYGAVSVGSIYTSINYGASFSTASGTSGLGWTSIVVTNVGATVYGTVSTGKVWKSTGVVQYTYKIRVAKNINGFNNLTAYSSFIPTSTAYNDTPPSFSVAIVSNNPTLTIALPNVASLGYTARDIVVLRQYSGGYGIIRNGTISNVGLASGSISITDYEAPRNKTATYKVKAVYRDALGNTYVGTAVNDSIARPALTSWWIQKCDGSDAGIAINALLSGGLGVSRNRPQTHLYPLGSRYPITVSGTVQGYDGDITIYFDNNPAFLAFATYLDYVGKLLISNQAGAYKYITFDKTDVSKAVGRGSDILRDLKLVYTEEDSGLGFNESYLYEF